MNFILRLKRWIDRMLEMAIQGYIVRSAGDDDKNDIIDHKTGKRK